MDHPVLNNVSEQAKEWLEVLKQVAIEVNKKYANILGINCSVAITCVKPSGTVSQLVDSASGIHGRFAPYYIRRVRGDVKDPLTIFMRDQGVPFEVDLMNKDNLVFSFPMKSPVESKAVNDMTAMEQLEHWSMFNDIWCEHKPSVSMYYKDEEFLALGQEVYNNFDRISGISFMPYSDHKYPQAPYEEIDEETYLKMEQDMPSIDWDAFIGYEIEDNTTSAKELACSSGICEI